LTLLFLFGVTTIFGRPRGSATSVVVRPP